MKRLEREEARRLRRSEGLSVRTIADVLCVSSSSVSRWVRDVPLTAEQEAALVASDPSKGGRLQAHRGWAELCRQRRLDAQAAGRDLAAAETPLHVMGCMLFWAEGSKSRNSVKFTNSDADMLRVFVRFLRECYGVPDERMALSVNVHLNNGLSLEDIHAWWLEGLDLPPECLRAASVNRPSKASRWRRNVLPYGTARVAVHSTEIVQSIYGAIQAYGGFEREAWVA